MKPVLALITLTIAIGSYAQSKEAFQTCLIGLQERAKEIGIEEQIINEVVPVLQQQQRVLELDRQQPEFIQTFGQYLTARVTDNRVETGRKLYTSHRNFLDQLTRQYGVPGQYLVALWGLETNFGSYLGNTPTLDALATLACDPRRSEFFSAEFLAALRVLEREVLTPKEMRGSWAGAMGHTQFMPSSYLKFAVDGDGDDSINLWQSPKDALASGAKLLQQLGWVRGLRWGREVKLPGNFDFSSITPGESLSMAKWVSLGVQRADGSPLPSANVKGSLLVPAGSAGPAFLVYDNFTAIMGWNRSESYAIAVGHLADRIAGGGTLYKMPPLDQAALTRKEMLALQQALNRLGYQAGEPDGIFGPATRAALIAYQKKVGFVSDGFPNLKTRQRLLADATAD